MKIIPVLVFILLPCVFGCDNNDGNGTADADADANADAVADTQGDDGGRPDTADDGIEPDTADDGAVPDDVIDDEGGELAPYDVPPTEDAADDGEDIQEDAQEDAVIPPTCGDGIVNHVDEECDDANEVSGDGCESNCRFSCYEHADCDDGNVCTAYPSLGTDACDPYIHVCLTEPVGDGIVCDPGNPCTGVGSCLGGECHYAGAIDCDDHLGCTIDTCNPDTESCTYEYIEEGTECNDGLFCTSGDQCYFTGRCVGIPDSSHCNDSNPCTDDACNEDTDTCDHTPVLDFHEAECGEGATEGYVYGSTGQVENYRCGGSDYSEPGPDQVISFTFETGGTFSVAMATGTGTLYFMNDVCDGNSCVERGTSISRSVTAGTYYVVVETVPDSLWGITFVCPGS